MRLEVDTTRIAILADAFGANMKQMEAAELRALNKTMAWLRTRAVRAVSEEMKLAAHLVRQRVANYRATRRQKRGKVWAGLRAIEARRLGRFRQLKTGVRVGRHTFKGAFISAMDNGRTGIWERTGEAKRTTTKGRYAGTNTKREPIREVKIEMNQETRDALAELFGQANERFFTVLRQELKYQVYVKNAR